MVYGQSMAGSNLAVFLPEAKLHYCLKIPVLYVLILAIVQGLTELLPVSSSAHVVVSEKLLAP